MTSLIDIDMTLAKAFGQDCYRVGGSVRDEILGKRPKDGDYVVRGRSMDSVFRRLAPLGKISPLKLRTGQHIGYRCNMRGTVIEVVLPRKEVSTGPGRHDFEIIVDPSIPIGEDCLRRDFTFNALYKHLWDGTVADPTARGLYDLERKLICTTHPDSFRDDPLRMLRALRFESCLGFDLSTPAMEQMAAHSRAAIGLNSRGNMSGTVWDELRKLLMGDRPCVALRDGFNLGPLRVLFPDLDGSHGDSFDRLESAVKFGGADLEVRLALMFHEAGPDAFLDAARELSGMPKQIKVDVHKMLQHPVSAKGGGIAARARFLRVEFGDELAQKMILTRLCVLAGLQTRSATHAMQNVGLLEEKRRAAQEARIPATVKELQIDGRDVIESGIQGANIGWVLRQVLNQINRDPQPWTLSREGQMKLMEIISGVSAS